MNAERMKILEMVEQGVISASQAAGLLASLHGDAEAAADPIVEQLGESTDSQAGALPRHPSEPTIAEERPAASAALAGEFVGPPPDLARWRRFWLYPLGVGFGVGGVSGLLFFFGLQASWAGIWLVCLALPFLAGLALFLLGLATRRARWLHVRVNTGQAEWPRRVAISLPLPIRTTAWILRLFRGRIPGAEEIALDEILLALGESATPDAPIYVEVDEGSGKEKVEVYIG